MDIQFPISLGERLSHDIGDLQEQGRADGTFRDIIAAADDDSWRYEIRLDGAVIVAQARWGAHKATLRYPWAGADPNLALGLPTIELD